MTETPADRFAWSDVLDMANGTTLRYTRDAGVTWDYAIVHNRPRSTGNSVTLWREVRDGVHMKVVLHKDDFENEAFAVEGVRGAAGKEWSYRGLLWDRNLEEL